MTSVVDTSVKHFMNTMSGAPVLSGTAGAMIAVLDACLVNGFDVKVATSLVVASGVATLSFAGTHSATVDSVVLVEGVTGPLTALNGEQKVTAIAAGVVKFATAAADGTAAGTITFKMAPAGWEKVFSGTNLAVYRSLDPQSTKMHLRVDDTGTISCRIRGFETMTDVNTGTGPFPTDAQISGGGHMNKSAAANATAVKWQLIADARAFFINVVGNSSSIPANESGRTVFIGDIITKRPSGDPYGFLIGCATTTGYGEFNGTCDNGDTASIFSPRGYSGLGTSQDQIVSSEVGTSGMASGCDPRYGAFPDGIDGGLMLSRKFTLLAINNPQRGLLGGLYTIPQSNVGLYFAPRSVISGVGALIGRKLLALGCKPGATNYPSATLGISLIDITGPWRA